MSSQEGTTLGTLIAVTSVQLTFYHIGSEEKYPITTQAKVFLF